MAHTKGPASTTPNKASGQFSAKPAWAEATPQPKAHMGGNQVMGFNNSRTADGFSRGAGAVAAVATGAAIALPLSLLTAIGAQITKAVAMQFHVKTLPTQPEHFRSRCTIIA